MKTAVIGAGLGGLSVAARLAAKGVHVDLFNTAKDIGGKASVFRSADGLEWDMGPTLLTLPNEVTRLLRQHEQSNVQIPEFLKVLDGTHVYFSHQNHTSYQPEWRLPAAGPGGAERMAGGAIGNKTMEFFQQAFPQEVAQLEKLLRMAQDVYVFGREKILTREPPNTAELGAISLLSGLAFKYPGLVHLRYTELIVKLLKDPNLREFFLHFASYVGVQPSLASASLVSIAHVELTEEVVFPKGGMGKIAQFLFHAGLEAGVNYLPGSRVVELAPVGKNDLQNRGWKLRFQNCAGRGADAGGLEEYSGGAPRTFEHHYDKVIVACDPHQALTDWLHSPTLRSRWLLDVVERRLRPSESQFVIFFAKTCSARLAHHTKIFPKSFSQSYWEVGVQNVIPSDPCVYLVWPHATDPSYSPTSLFISAMAPQLDSGHSWNKDFSADYCALVLNKLRERGLGLQGEAVGWRTPMDFYRQTGSLRGGIYGATVARAQVAHFSRSGVPPVPNLFFVGGGIHPGAGVPMVLLGAERVFNAFWQQVVG